MTISSSVGVRKTIEKICLTAYQSVGLRSTQQGTDDKIWKSEFRFAREKLEEILNGLSVHGVFARARSFYDYTLSAAEVTAETYQFTLPDTVLNLLEPAMWIPAGEDLTKPSGMTPLMMVTQEHWQRLSSKSAIGTPTLFYEYRTGEQIQAWVWPIPDEAGTLRFLTHRKLADADDGDATLDLEEYWLEYISLRLQAALAQAKALPLALVQTLEGRAQTQFPAVKGKAVQAPASRAVLDHRTGWSRR